MINKDFNPSKFRYGFRRFSIYTFHDYYYDYYYGNIYTSTLYKIRGDDDGTDNYCNFEKLNSKKYQLE